MKTVDQMSGEEIANAIAVNYDKLIQAQNNLQILRAELDKRNKAENEPVDSNAI